MNINFIYYFGNKYNESKKYLNNFDYSKFKNICEPFGGTFGFSRYVYEINNNIQFHINDINKILIEICEYIKNNNDLGHKLEKYISDLTEEQIGRAHV